MTVPVYDYALMTEPLTADQREAIGWRGREGISDLGNQFHYFRTTRDGRILWGGYDAIYHYGSGLKDEYDQRAETFEALAQNFFTTFPQLTGLGFSHAWGGVIDTCTRFAAFYGTALGGRVGYALGFTGLGVGATRFAGDVLLDLLAGLDTPRTRLEMVRKKPLPFPPEPARWAGIEATRRSLARADANNGKENLWLQDPGPPGPRLRLLTRTWLSASPAVDAAQRRCQWSSSESTASWSVVRSHASRGRIAASRRDLDHWSGAASVRLPNRAAPVQVADLSPGGRSRGRSRQRSSR